MEQRYPGLRRKPIEVSVPQIRNLDTTRLRGYIRELGEQKGWPEYIANWHAQNLKVKVTTPKNISAIMCNVNMPWKPNGCRCKEIEEALRKKDPNIKLPRTHGHILFTGREYTGPNQCALNTPANNVPWQSMWDAARAMEEVRKQLPASIRPTEKEWKTAMGKPAYVLTYFVHCETHGQRTATR